MSNENSDSIDESATNRRTVLKSVGATGAVGGMSGLATADGAGDYTTAEAQAATKHYRSVDAVKSAIADQPELLEAVAERGLFGDSSVEALGIETYGKPVSENDINVTVLPHATAGGVTADIRVDAVLEDGFFAMSVKPELDESFAVFKPDGAKKFEEVYQSSHGCDSDCDDCEIICNYANNSARCPKSGKDGFGYTVRYQCNDDSGW